MKSPASFLLLWTLLSWACNGSDASSSGQDALLRTAPYYTLTDSIDEQPRDAALYFRRAVLLNTNNQPGLALADFRKAWELDKQETYAIGAGRLYLENKPDSAVVFLKNVIRELPESIFLQLMLARAYDATGRTDEALKVTEQVMALDSNQVNILLFRAEMLEKKKDTTGMIASLEKAHQLMPRNRDIANKLAYQYAETRNPRALAVADELIRTDSLLLDAGAYYVKGMYYLNTNNRKKAMELFDQTIRNDHRYLNAYVEKGKLQFHAKDISAAMATFKLLNTISPAFPDAWYWIGRCQESTGDKKSARLNYQKAYELDKSFTEAKEAMESIPE